MTEDDAARVMTNESQSDRQGGDDLAKWHETRELAILLGRPWQVIFLIDVRISQAQFRAALEEK